MQITSTIDLVEIIRLVVCLPGLLYLARILTSAIQDLYALKLKRINSIREYGAITTVIGYLISFIVQFSYVYFAISAMLSKNTYNDVRILNAAVFIFTSLVIDILSFTVERRRTVLLRKIADIEEGI